MIIFRNILSIIVGWLVGGAINMGLINYGLIKYPVEGLDPEDMEAYAAIFPSLSSEHFIFPFLAHVLGTFFGALLAGLIAGSHKMKFALGIGVLFLSGGIYMAVLFKGPMWFIAVDLIFAYIPMAHIAGKIATRFTQRDPEVL